MAVQPNISTIIRVILLIISLINMALAMLGIVPEELVGNEEAYQIGSYIVTAVVSVINMWKNNSFSQEAILADQYMKSLKDNKKNSSTTDSEE